MIAASGSSFAEKGLYVHALHNIGYGTSNVLDALLEFAAKTSGEESANDLRCYVIKGLAKNLSNDDDNDEKVWNVLVALVRDSAESFRVRIEAAKALLGTQPTARAVQEMRRLLLSPNEGGLGDGQVRHYVTSAVRTIAESRNPCNRHLSVICYYYF
jgi:HEAT repeat protein